MSAAVSRHERNLPARGAIHEPVPVGRPVWLRAGHKPARSFAGSVKDMDGSLAPLRYHEGDATSGRPGGIQALRDLSGRTCREQLNAATTSFGPALEEQGTPI